MSKFRQQSSIRVSSPRYTNPASGGLATGEAVILDSTPVVNTAIQLAEKDRANAQYFDYLKQEKVKKDEKDYIEFNDKLSKVLEKPTVAGLNRFDTELILKKLKSTREKAVNILGDVASSGNYMLKNKVLQQVQSEIDDIGSEIVSRKNAYEQRKSEYQANGKIMSLTGQSDYAERIESTPTLDEKGQYISLQYDPKYIEGADLSKIYKDVSEVANYSLDVPVSVVNKGEPASYNKYKLNKDRAYSMLVRSLQDELSTDNAVKVASSLGDEYNDFLRRNGQKEVPKDAFVSYRGVNKDNVNAILNDKRFIDEHLLINVHEKQDKGTFIPSKGKSGDENNVGQGGEYYLPVRQEIGNGKYREGTIRMKNVSLVPSNKNVDLSVNETLYDVSTGKYMPLRSYLSSVVYKDSKGVENTKDVKSYTITAIREGDVAVSKLKEDKSSVLDKITNVFNPKKGGQYSYSKEDHPLLNETYDKLKDKSNVQNRRQVEANIDIKYDDNSSETISVLIDADKIQQTKKQKSFKNRSENNQRSW